MWHRITDWNERLQQRWSAWKALQPLAGLTDTRDALLGLVFPPQCALCDTEVGMGLRLCDSCRQGLASEVYCCQRCAMPLPSVLPNDECIHCRKSKWKFSRVIALGQYRGRLKEAVIYTKKMKGDSLRYALSELLADRVKQRIPCGGAQIPILLPVPNHWSRAFSGAAPTAFHLAWLLARHTGWPVKCNMARRIRKTGKQGLLSIRERRQNVRGAFKKMGSHSLTGRHVLIVDDVLTSGATADELARQVSRNDPAEISVDRKSVV